MHAKFYSEVTVKLIGDILGICMLLFQVGNIHLCLKGYDLRVHGLSVGPSIPGSLSDNSGRHVLTHLQNSIHPQYQQIT